MNYKKLKIHEGQRINSALNEFFEDETDKNIALLSAIYGKSRDYYSSIPQGELLQLIEQTGWMAQLPKKEYLRPFRSGRYVYKLKVLRSQLSPDEFILFQKITADDYIPRLHEGMALLMTKYLWFPFSFTWMGKRYYPTRVRQTPEEFEARSKLFKEKMSFALANACMVFFSASYPIFLEAGHSYFQGIKEAAEEFQKTP